MAAEQDSCLRELEIEIPTEVVEKETNRVVQEFTRVARVPGFRPGKAPASLVRQRFWEEIRNEVLHSLIPASLESTFREKNLHPVDRPSIGDLEFEPSKPLRFRASFEVLPNIQLGDYRRLEIQAVKLRVTDEDVVRELEALREQAATLEPVEDRGAEDGDTAVLSLLGTVVEPPSAVAKPIVLNDALCHIGAETTLEAFTQGLQGARPEEERTLTVTYPADYPERELAGCTVRYQARVKALKRNRLPELNDDFAQQVGEFKTLEELKQKLRESLEAARARAERELTEDRLLDALLARHSFPVPELLVEAQMDTRLERRLRGLISQGLDPRRLDLDWAHLRRQQRPAAERDVRIGLLLDRIAQAEHIEVSEAELEADIARLAADSGQGAEAVRARLTSEGGLDRIRRAIRSRKVLELLHTHARIRDE